jgi:hypothetical protein
MQGRSLAVFVQWRTLKAEGAGIARLDRVASCTLRWRTLHPDAPALPQPVVGGVNGRTLWVRQNRKLEALRRVATK